LTPTQEEGSDKGEFAFQNSSVRAFDVLRRSVDKILFASNKRFELPFSKHKPKQKVKIMQSMDNLKKLGKLDQAANDSWAKFQDLNTAVMAEGAISVKNKELIALGVALTTQCGYCLELHRQGAEKAGASQAEIAETIMIAGALRAGAALTHGTQILADS